MAMNPKTLRPRVSGFNPKSISGLHAWYDASDASTITQGTGVSAWADKSGNGRTCSQATGANQPAYVLAGQNGKNVIDFASATKNMVTNGTAWALTSTNTMFWSFRFPNTAASAATYSLFDFNTNRESVFGNATSEMRVGSGLMKYDAVTNLAPTSSRWLIVSISWSGATTRYRINETTGGVLSGLVNLTSRGVAIDPTATFYNGASTQMYMGFNGGSASIRGQIGEHLSYDSTLTAKQITDVNLYLAEKWGATIV
jgi:hypothetical protein